MKNLFIYLLVIGSANVMFSQNSNSEFLQMEAEKVAPLLLNIEYLNAVQDNSMSIHVKSLEEEAAKCDIKASTKFNGSSKPFKAVFKSNKGAIKVLYNQKGEVIESSEKFEDVKLPNPVRDYVFNNHSGWILSKTGYMVSYNKESGSKKVYKVQIRKGNLKKNLKIDSDGNII
tara:strand:+ start:100 stop:618 length:519 start_codon:yes stop_codon:yes gene_type:complete